MTNMLDKKFDGMWYVWLWWLCDEDDDFYAHNIILSLMVRQENWPRPTWRIQKVRHFEQYPIDLCDRETCLKGVLKIKRQMLYITIRDRNKPWWALRYELRRQAKRINEIVRELF